jgi:hypothetical protein
LRGGIDAASSAVAEAASDSRLAQHFMPYPATAAKRCYLWTTTLDGGQNGAQKSCFGMNFAKFYAVRF